MNWRSPIAKVGEIIDGRFELLAEIGHGGMGLVFRARDVTSGAELALKLCPGEDADDRKRFGREIRVLAGISHPNVIQVLAHNIEHDPPYFVMPVATGSLADEGHGWLSEDEALDAFVQLCEGIQAIHNTGATHRDIKPANALRLDDGRVVVSDLGLVKIDSRDATTLTGSMDMIGTWIYCAPEQMAPGGSKKADKRTDVYQLGKTLYELIAGEAPTFVDPKKLPPGLAYVVQRATSDQPERRYRGVGELRDAVETYRLSKVPAAAPEATFEMALGETAVRSADGRYQTDNLDRVVVGVRAFEGDPARFLQQFDRIPVPVLIALATQLPDAFRELIESYADAVDTEVGRYPFPYAEAVAAKMMVAVENALDPRTKALAIGATLSAAFQLNRYAAIDSFNAMLLGIRDDEVAMAVADILRESEGRYRSVAAQIPEGQLHPILEVVRKNASSGDTAL